MSLIANKETKTKIENRLNEYSKVGITLYYLYEQNRVNINDLKNVFFSEDDEKSCFIYGNIIKHVKTKDIKEMKEKYNIINSNADELNVFYTKKIIEKIINESKDKIDKSIINLYDNFFFMHSILS